MTDATVAAGAEAHGGLLDGTLRFGWGRAATGADDSASEIDVMLWEGVADAAL
jgi:hypothetical protein